MIEIRDETQAYVEASLSDLKEKEEDLRYERAAEHARQYHACLRSTCLRKVPVVADYCCKRCWKARRFVRRRSHDQGCDVRDHELGSWSPDEAQVLRKSTEQASRHVDRHV